jgi:hypothetical protein
MHSPSQLFLDLPERRPHAIAPCNPLLEELLTAVAGADEGKAEEVEGFRLAEPTPSASFGCKAAEFDQVGLVVRRQVASLGLTSAALSNSCTKIRKRISQQTGRTGHIRVGGGSSPLRSTTPISANRRFP